MVDFKALMNRTPEEREASRKEQEAQFKAEDQRVKLMADKLYDQMQRDCIGNPWAETFIESIHVKVHSTLPFLTDKQLKILEELFERY